MHFKCVPGVSVDWKNSTLKGPGSFTDGERGKMFLSQQTYEGFTISVHSHVEAIQFLLGKGFQVCPD